MERLRATPIRRVALAASNKSMYSLIGLVLVSGALVTFVYLVVSAIIGVVAANWLVGIIIVGLLYIGYGNLKNK